MPSIGTVGDSFDNPLAETVNGYDKTELIRGPARTGPWKTIEEVELATPGWVHWHNTKPLYGYLDVPPAEFEARFYATRQGDKTLAYIKRQSLHQPQHDSIDHPSDGRPADADPARPLDKPTAISAEPSASSEPIPP